jgi:hypothetical protein
MWQDSGMSGWGDATEGRYERLFRHET